MNYTTAQLKSILGYEPGSGAIRLLTAETAKMRKNATEQYLSCVLHMHPNVAVCPDASPQCLAQCLNTAGRGRMESVSKGRRGRTHNWLNNRDAFLEALRRDIRLWERRAAKRGLRLAVRLNGTSDIAWENTGIIAEFPNVQFYDYTKTLSRALCSVMLPQWPKNYDLTFSRTESNWSSCVTALKSGCRVAVVFSDAMPVGEYMGHPVHDGVGSDLRFLDGPGIVALKALGKAKKATPSTITGKSFTVIY